MEANTPDPSLLSALNKANKIFRRKDYFQSLEKYSECLRMLPKTDSLALKDLEMCIYSLRGMNYSAIREFEKADQDFSFVLKHRIYDATTLMRRACLNLKLKQYKRAMDDIVRLVEIEPDSIRVAALMLEAKDKLSKIAEEEQKEQLNKALDDINNLNTDDLDEDEMLNFCNLKKIDRKSVTLAPTKSRVSQVCFKEDTENSYDATEDPTPTNKIQEKLSQAQIQHILESQKSDLIDTETEKDRYKISIVCKPVHKKSILKKSSIRVAVPTTSEISSEDHTLNAFDVRNIEGKPIRNSISKVKFRKSEIDPRQLPIAPMEALKKPSRKSCLKQSSFGLQSLQGKFSGAILDEKPYNGGSENASSGRPSRNQSFLHLKMDLADGKLLSKSEGFGKKKERQEGADIESAKSFDSGDEYNIFGCDGSFEISEKIKKTLGLEDSHPNKENKAQSNQPKPSKMAKKSILKKNSIIKQANPIPIGLNSQNTQPPPQQSTKPKKSVLFK